MTPIELIGLIEKDKFVKFIPTIKETSSALYNTLMEISKPENIFNIPSILLTQLERFEELNKWLDFDYNGVSVGLNFYTTFDGEILLTIDFNGTEYKQILTKEFCIAILFLLAR